jgi:hypothetical protein
VLGKKEADEENIPAQATQVCGKFFDWKLDNLHPS